MPRGRFPVEPTPGPVGDGLPRGAEVEGKLEPAPDLGAVLPEEFKRLADERLDGGEPRPGPADSDPDEERVDGGIGVRGR